MQNLKFKSLTIFCLLLIHSSLNGNEIPEPYRSVKELPFDDHGWFGNARQLDWFLADEPKTIIEVGSWLGCSTRYLAANQPEDGILYAVDTWCGSPLESVHQQDPRLSHLYHLFLSNIKHAGLAYKIVPVRMASVEAAKAMNVKADLIYLDAAHDTQSVLEDIEHWYPHLKEGGVMCGDDWLWESVRIAVIKKAEDLKKTVHHDQNFWWYGR